MFYNKLTPSYVTIQFLQNLFIGKFSPIYMKNEDSEPPGGHKNDRKNTTLFRTGNIERYITNSLLYLRWKTFGVPCVIPEYFGDSVELFRYRGSGSKS